MPSMMGIVFADSQCVACTQLLEHGFIYLDTVIITHILISGVLLEGL